MNICFSDCIGFRTCFHRSGEIFWASLHELNSLNNVIELANYNISDNVFVMVTSLKSGLQTFKVKYLTNHIAED